MEQPASVSCCAPPDLGRRTAILLLFSCALALTSAACGPRVQRTVMGPAYPPLPADTEIFVTSLGQVECPFEELGLITVRDSEFNSRRDFLPTLKEQARDLGGDGLLGLRHVPPVQEDETWGGLEATVIRFTDPGCHR